MQRTATLGVTPSLDEALWEDFAEHLWNKDIPQAESVIDKAVNLDREDLCQAMAAEYNLWLKGESDFNSDNRCGYDLRQD